MKNATPKANCAITLDHQHTQIQEHRRETGEEMRTLTVIWHLQVYTLYWSVQSIGLHLEALLKILRILWGSFITDTWKHGSNKSLKHEIHKSLKHHLTINIANARKNLSWDMNVLRSLVMNIFCCHSQYVHYPWGQMTEEMEAPLSQQYGRSNTFFLKWNVLH